MIDFVVHVYFYVDVVVVVCGGGIRKTKFQSACMPNCI